MWRKVQCLQNVKSCQISIGRSVLINTVFVGKEEEVPSVESISKVWFPGKKPQSILLLLEDGAKVSEPGIRRWCRPSTQADAASACASGNSDSPLNSSHSTVYKAHLPLGLYLFLASILCNVRFSQKLS